MMTDVISEYQKWKQQGDELRLKAKQAMEARFRELLLEAARMADEYRKDFGAVLKPPAAVTAFRYKPTAKMNAKKSVPQKPSAKTSGRPAPAPEKPDPKLGGIQKRLMTAKRKLEDAKTAGKPTRPLEDKVYEIEDELRLAAQA
jgi:hypothetical protein